MISVYVDALGQSRKDYHLLYFLILQRRSNDGKLGRSWLAGKKDGNKYVF